MNSHFSQEDARSRQEHLTREYAYSMIVLGGGVVCLLVTLVWWMYTGQWWALLVLIFPAVWTLMWFSRD